MAENPRIEELRRRVQKDPASIAFAQLAEEYRRAGNYEEAIAICHVGLQTHPSYLSARVTLGRALIETHDLESAETQLRYVLEHAAENLAAIRALAEIHHRRGELSEALSLYRSALELARHDPDLEQVVDEISRAVNPVPAPVVPPASPAVLSSEDTTFDFSGVFDKLEMEPDSHPEPEPTVQPEPGTGVPIDAAPDEATPIEAMPGETAAMETAPVETALPIDALEAVERVDTSDLEPIEEIEPVDLMGPLEMEMENGALPKLERFLETIHTYRQRRAV